METLTEKIKTIARLPNNGAILLQARLQADGIDCFLSHENLLQAAVSMGVEIKVRESDMERALKLIDRYKEDSRNEREKSSKTLGHIKRILVPVDFSTASQNAVKLAIDFAKAFGAEIRLYHVFYNPVIEVAPFDTSHAYHINLTNYLHEIEQNARKQMADMVQGIKKQVTKEKLKVRITQSIANGIAADEILSMSHKYRPGLIIMGSKGIGKQSEGMMGSVTLKVAAKSEVPVIALPDNSKMTSIAKIRHIMYATDFDEYDQESLRKLINLTDPLKLTLHCVHVSVGKRRTWDNVKMDALKRFINEEFNELSLKIKIIVSDDVLNGLETYIRENPVDIIALTNHSRGLLDSFFTPSITRMIMQRISKPLFVFKAK